MIEHDQTIVVVDNCDTEDLPQKIGKYTIIRMLGKGGMGTVYLGKDPMLDRLAAIKTLHTPPESMSIENRKQLVQRFLREAKSLAKINHNNIIKIYAIGRHERHALHGHGIRRGADSNGDLQVALGINPSIRNCST